MFKKALKALPSGIAYDQYEHQTVSDLVFLVQHELDLINEEPEHFENVEPEELKKLVRKYIAYIKKYST